MSEIIIGNALEVMADMEAESVHCIITSPPYWGLRDYGCPEVVFGGDEGCEHDWGHKRTISVGRNDGGRDIGGRGGNYQDDGPHMSNASAGSFCSLCGAWRGQFGLEPTPEAYVEHTLQFLRAIHRVLRKDGTVWWVIGDSYAGSGKGQMGDGTHAAKCGEKQKTNKGTTVGGLPTCYNGLKPKDLVMIPFRVALAAQADGWWVRSVIVWSKPNPMPESVRDRPTTAHEYVLLMAKSKRYYYDQDAIREPQTGNAHSRGKGITPKSVEEGIGIKSNVSFHEATSHYTQIPGGRNKRTVWEITTKPYSGSHYATFPPDLVEPMILAGTSPKVCAECGAPWERVVEKTKYEPQVVEVGIRNVDQSRGDKTRKLSGPEYNRQVSMQTIGWRPTCDHNAGTKPALVLDPFSGTGTVAEKCIEHGRDYVMIDIDPKNKPLMDERLEAIQRVMAI